MDTKIQSSISVARGSSLSLSLCPPSPPPPAPLTHARWQVRELKAAKAPKDEITAAVDALLALKAEKANSPFAAGPRGGEGEGTGQDSYSIVTDTDGTSARQPGQPFSQVEAKALVSAARERLEAGGAFRDRVLTKPLCY